jgi:hypothetical protein
VEGSLLASAEHVGLTGFCILACGAPLFVLIDEPSMPLRAIGLVMGVVLSAALRGVLDR